VRIDSSYSITKAARRETDLQKIAKKFPDSLRRADILAKKSAGGLEFLCIMKKKLKNRKVDKNAVYRLDYL
jgi:hypothetical protein